MVLTQNVVKTMVSVGSIVGECQSPDVSHCTSALVQSELSEAQIQREMRLVRHALRNWRHAVAMDARDAVERGIVAESRQPSSAIMATIAHGYCPPSKTTLAVRSVVGLDNYVSQDEQSTDNGKTWQRMVPVKMDAASYPARPAIDWSRESQAVMDSLICKANGDTLGHTRFLDIIDTENKIHSRNIARRDGTAEMGRQYRAAWLARGFRSQRDIDDGILRPSQPDRRWIDTMSDSQKKRMTENNERSVKRWEAKGVNSIDVTGVHTIPDIDVDTPAFWEFSNWYAKHWSVKEGLIGHDATRSIKTRSRPRSVTVTENGKTMKRKIRTVSREMSEYRAEILAEMTALQLLARIGNRPFGFGPAVRIARQLVHQRGIDRANRHHLAILNLRNGLIASGADGETIDSARNHALSNVAKAIGGTASAPLDGKPKQNQWLVGQGINSIGSTESRRASAPKSEYVPTDPRLADRLRDSQLTSRNEDIATATLEACELIADQRLTDKQRQFLAAYLAADCSATRYAKQTGNSVGSVSQYLDAIRDRLRDDISKEQRARVGQILRDAVGVIAVA